MAPRRKSNKKPAAGDWSDEDVGEPTPDAPSEGLPSDTPHAWTGPPAAKGKKPKAKQAKGNGKAADDWGSDDDVPAAPLPPEAVSDADEAPPPPARSKAKRGQQAAASVYAMLGDVDGGGDEDGEPESRTSADAAADSDAEAPASDCAPAAKASSRGEQVGSVCCRAISTPRPRL